MISTNQSSLHTLTEIASVLKLSYQQTYNTYKDLLLDLNDIDPDREIMSSKMKEVVSQQSDISVDVYRLYLLRKSIAFQALNYAATTKNTDMAAFTNQYFISKSTLIRKLDKLRVLLRRYDINLSITTLKLSGSELKIRFFLYTIYRIGFHYTEWPFPTVRQETVAQLLSNHKFKFINKLSRLQAETFMAICRIRVISGYQLKDSAVKDSLLVDQKLPIHNLLVNRDHPTMTSKQLENENKIFDFFYLCVIQQKPVTNEVLQQDSSMPDGNLVGFLLERFNTFATKYFPEMADQINNDPDLQKDLTNLAISYILADGHRPETSDFYVAQDIIGDKTYFYQKIVQFVYEEVTPLLDNGPRQLLPASLHPSRKDFINDLYKTIFRHYVLLQDDELVKIKTVIDQDSVLNSAIYHSIKHIQYLKILPEEVPWSDADLIITTLPDPSLFLENDTDDPADLPPILYWSTLNPNSSLMELIKSIEEIFNTKNATPLTSDQK